MREILNMFTHIISFLFHFKVFPPEFLIISLENVINPLQLFYFIKSLLKFFNNAVITVILRVLIVDLLCFAKIWFWNRSSFLNPMRFHCLIFIGSAQFLNISIQGAKKLILLTFFRIYFWAKGFLFVVRGMRNRRIFSRKKYLIYLWLVVSSYDFTHFMGLLWWFYQYVCIGLSPFMIVFTEIFTFANSNMLTSFGQALGLSYWFGRIKFACI